MALAMALAVMLGACSDGGSPEQSGQPEATTPPPTPTATPLGLSQTANPFLGRPLYAWPYSPGAAAVSLMPPGPSRDLLQRLVSVPTAVWLTPERYPAGNLGTFVREVVTDAVARQEVPVFVLYGVPGRDCVGRHSAGGLDAGSYLAWVQEFAAAAGTDAVVVLEPDALASVESCPAPGARLRVLRRAVGILATGPVTYVDAGHEGWRSPQDMARLLRRVGVEAVRGFAVNVSSYGTDADELDYAEQVADDLPGSHFVVDSGRNGNGPKGTRWCNPPGRSLGIEPSVVDDGSAWDARLWIKPPGESDGPCRGGPAAGEFWPEQALRLAAAAGW